MSKKTPIEGFEKWLQTGAGKKALQSVMDVNNQHQYKKNCLWWAYQAGAASKNISLVKPIDDLIMELKGRKAIPRYLQKQIEYIIQHKDDFTIHNQK